MKKRIYRSLCLTVLMALCLSTIASLSLYLSFYAQESRRDLQSRCRNLASAAAEIEALDGDILPFLQNAADDPSVRITLIQADGSVLWDSQASAADMENHSDRKEFQQALAGSLGEDSRISNTAGQDTYYCALRFGADGQVLRLGRNTKNALGTFLQILPLDVISCVLLFLFCLLLANRETRKIVDPLLKAANNLEQGELYEELSPFIRTIRRQNDTIRAQLESIRQDKDTITLILKNMKEGLVMLSKEKRILSVNNSAMEMLGSFLRNPEGQKFVLLTRNGSLLTAVEQALKGNSSSGILPSDPKGRSYQFFADPVLGPEKEISGVLLFLMDVTEQLQAQKSREEFSANVSHELKTPLTSISGFAELMESGMASSAEDVKQFSGLIRKEASRLLSLIDDIIRLSRIEEGHDSTLEAVDLYALAKEECQRLLSAAQTREITIRCDGSAAVMNGNSTMLREVVYNLCENAVKYNVPGGFVQVNVAPQEGQVVLTVFDSGIGIPKEHHDRIFERFYRVDKSRSKETGGTGLGLSIVKHVVQRHNGQLSMESEPGKGTRITARFPVISENTRS